MTGPRRSEGRGVSMPRMRPCAVEMTGTVCCAHEEAEKRLMLRQRERRRDTNPNGDKKDGRGDGGEGFLLVLCSDMMMCLGIPDGKGAGTTTEREKTKAVLTLQRYPPLTHSCCSAWPIAHTTSNPGSCKQPFPFVCVFLVLFVSQ